MRNLRYRNFSRPFDCRRQCMQDVIERPKPTRGITHLTGRDLRLQRRVTLAFTVLPPIGVVAAIIAMWGTAITATDFWIGFAFYWFTGLGITVGYHRLFTHRAFKAVGPVRTALAV